MTVELDQDNQTARPDPATQPGPADRPAVKLPPLPQPSGNGALERLGPSPFAKGKVPFLGFLATVYEHLEALAKQQLKLIQPDVAQSDDEQSDNTRPYVAQSNDAQLDTARPDSTPPSTNGCAPGEMTHPSDDHPADEPSA